MKVSEGRAQARDGTHIAYSLHGDSHASRFAVLAHSLAMDRRFWAPVATRLAAGAAVLTYDSRGHGASETGSTAFSVEQFADDLADLLDHLGRDRATVAGASMGGCVSLAFAGRYPQRVNALGLIDTTAWYGPDAPRQWEERAQKALDGGLKALVDFQVTRWFSDDFRSLHPQVVAQCVDRFLRNDVRAYAASCRMLGAADLRKRLPGICVPAAVVVGEEDYATPVSMAEELHRGIGGSSFTVLKQARHLTPLEKPAEVADELRKLLE
jgi:3-oxoadipate enol-lactonase